MSVDYFDDEFLEKIPSIAPDLMFVEENAANQQQQSNTHKSHQAPNITSGTKKVIVDDLGINELMEITVEPHEEVLIDVDDSEPNSPKLDSPIDIIGIKDSNESAELSKEPITLTTLDKESLLNFIIDDHSYARPFGPVKDEDRDAFSCTTSLLKLHPRDLLPKKIDKDEAEIKTGDNEDVDDVIDVIGVEKPKELLIRLVIYLREIHIMIHIIVT